LKRNLPDSKTGWQPALDFQRNILIQDEAFEASYQVCIAEDITDQSQVRPDIAQSLGRSREQFTLSRRMSLARKPEVVLKTLMSASELRSAKRAFVLFF